MTELELVGYTADMHYLVLSDPDQRGSRWYVPIDDDFLNTVEELVQDDPRPPSREPEDEWPDGHLPGVGPGSGPLAAVAAAAGERGIESRDGQRSPSSSTSRLSPRQIQALLRAGKTPRNVAKQAETDEAWVRRWLPPIESERSQVLQAVWASSVAKSRLGRSHDLLGEAVRKNLNAKGVDPESDTVSWSATRKEGATAWTVTLRYRNRGSTQRAVWRFDPERHLLEPRNQLAVDIAWTRPRQSESATGTTQKAAGKKAAGTKSASDQAAGKKAAGKKAAGKKAATKAAGKKAAGKKAAGKKSAGKKSAGKKSAGKKSAGKKSAGKKSATKAAGKKSATKAAGKKSATKAAGKKSATKAAGKKSATKAAGKKAAKKGPAENKATGKKAAKKGPAQDKAAGRKSAGGSSGGASAAKKAAKSSASQRTEKKAGGRPAAPRESAEGRGAADAGEPSRPRRDG